LTALIKYFEENEAVSKGRPLFLPVDLNVEKERAAEATLS